MNTTGSLSRHRVQPVENREVVGHLCRLPVTRVGERDEPGEESAPPPYDASNQDNDPGSEDQPQDNTSTTGPRYACCEQQDFFDFMCDSERKLHRVQHHLRAMIGLVDVDQTHIRPLLQEVTTALQNINISKEEICQKWVAEQLRGASCGVCKMPRMRSRPVRDSAAPKWCKIM